MRYLLPIPDLSKTDLIRLWSYIQKGNTDNCWNWLSSGGVLAPLTKVPEISIKDKMYAVPRVLWKVIHGNDPGEKLVLHTCSRGQRFNKCVNPNHMYLGTDSDNMYDAWDEGWKYGSGAFNPNSKLSSDDVNNIRRKYPLKTQKQLSIEYNVSESCIAAIIHRRSWRHI
jgi:hypothetical protein